MPTLLDKIFEAHLVEENPGELPLIYADRHLVHEVTSPQAFAGLRDNGRKVRRPDLTWAVMDHVLPTSKGRSRPLADPVAETQLSALDKNCRDFGIRLMDMDHPNQGIVHVTMPEQGFILPGQTVFCGDSHTTTLGAFGALAFGIGTSEVEHVLATQCLRQAKPSSMCVKVEGRLGPRVLAKDLILAIIGHIGFNGGTGHVIEYQGPAISALSMEGRMTVCNMSVECGAKAGFIAPDEITFKYLEGRPCAPQGDEFGQAVKQWRTLVSDAEAAFDKTVEMDVSALEPQVTWGTNPGQVCGIKDKVPDPAAGSEEKGAVQTALAYMGLEPGTPMEEVAVDTVFIGSCTGGRLEDLRQAAEVAKGRKVAAGVRALVVPGSHLVKSQAEAEGLDKVFLEAGFEWRLPGCSMCLAMNDDILGPGQRCASTSNRNFQGRQGPGARTHLVSPATAAASALAGRLADPREME